METPTPPLNQAETPAVAPAEVAPITLTPEMLAALGVPADQATPESVLAAITACAGAAKESETLSAQLAEAQGKLAEIEKAQTIAEVDALLADYALPEASATALRDLYGSNRDQAKALLSGFPKKTAPVPEVKPPDVKPAAAQGAPPKPMHDPKGEQTKAPTPEEKAKEADALILAIKKEGKFPTYDAARSEARRRQPDLFA